MCDCRVDEVRSTDDGYQITCSKGDGASVSLRSHRLVLASSAGDTARALAPVVPEAAEILRTIESASMVVLNLGFKRDHIAHPLEGFGFLVPHDEPDYPLLGILWADSIFPHHAPPDHRLIRVFIGGGRDPGAAERSEDELLATAMDASRNLLGLSGDPVLIDICPYKAAIPQYGLGYLEKMERLHAALAKHPRLHLVGNYLEGVSLNDCVRCGTRMAEEIAAADRPDLQPRQLEVPVAT
jgi:oxygen-dependent protoporphyrinogen oxidase